MGGKIVIIFDFDRTLIDDDADRWVINGMGLIDLFNQLRRSLSWTSLMDRMVEELHLQGKSVQDIAECLKAVPLHPRKVTAIKSAYALGCDLKILSDANHFYIETILKYHGLYDYFSEIITNPVAVNGEGRLQIFPYHGLAVSHGCELCPPNLCKGIVVERIQASMPQEANITYIYLGDGSGDYCPSLKLGEGDFIMPRKDFPLSDRISSNPMLLKASVHEWIGGEDLEKILLHLICTISTEENVKVPYAGPF